MGSLVVRASDSRRKGLGSMPDAAEYVLVKSVDPKVSCGLNHECRGQEYFPPLQFHGKIVKVKIDGVAIYNSIISFGNLTQLIRNVTCIVLKV
ncbi:hypothetical protein TNCV_4472111 [Trichonephila clavipes]|uniref:Uncharacterized protein n=1 Tax=Trichonephila clavipes TaxID=2585209 RepID=A0A8X6VLX5_TRICX|nr:hypothetical protein TNCV_4472111 [Trichonephila clavipes]